MNNTRFKALLAAIEEHDTHYDERYGLVLQAVSEAHRLGYAAGFRMDPQEPEWPTAYIELPTGQVSWHLAQHGRPWDGHTTREKYRRINAFAPQHCPWALDRIGAWIDPSWGLNARVVRLLRRIGVLYG